MIFLPRLTVILFFFIAGPLLFSDGQDGLSFTITASNKDEYTESILSGKISIIFYNSLLNADGNKVLKRELKAYYLSQPEILRVYFSILPVFDCKGLFWPLTYIVRKEMVKASEREGFEIYGDYDGSFKKAFGLEHDKIFFLVTDTDSRVVYSTHGETGEESVEEVITSIERIVIRMILLEEKEKLIGIMEAYKSDGFSREYLTEKFSVNNALTTEIKDIIDAVF